MLRFSRATTRCDFLSRGSLGLRPEGRFPFYFLFKKRQVEMTTLPSRVFVQVPRPEHVRGVFARPTSSGLREGPPCFFIILTVTFGDRHKQWGSPSVAGNEPTGESRKCGLTGEKGRCHRHLPRPRGGDGCGRPSPVRPPIRHGPAAYGVHAATAQRACFGSRAIRTHGASGTGRP